MLNNFFIDFELTPMDKILMRGLKQPKPKKRINKQIEYKIIGDEMEQLKGFDELKTNCYFQEPTLVQKIVIPYILNDNNVCVRSFTGSGKTLAYVLPILEMSFNKRIMCIIVVPYEQLVHQTFQVITDIAQSVDIHGYIDLETTLTKKAESNPYMSSIAIVKQDMLFENNIKEIYKDATHLIIDEADEIITKENPTFIQEMSKILDFKKVYVSVFSATITEYIEELFSLLKHTTRIYISQKLPFKHVFTFGTKDNIKHLALEHLLDTGVATPCLIFVMEADKGRALAKRFKNAEFYGGKMDGEALKSFRLKKIWYLFTTDVLSRGADFYNIKSVVNYDFPCSKTEFVHRCGRVNRNCLGQSVYTLYTVEDFSNLFYVVEFLKENGSQVDEHIENIIGKMKK